MNSSLFRLAPMLACAIVGMTASTVSRAAAAESPAASPPQAASDPARLAAKVAALEAKLAAVTDLQATVQYLRDRAQIHEVELRYMRGFDRRDEALLSSAFWPDAQLSYPGAKMYGVKDFAARHWPAHAKVSTIHNNHLLTNEFVEISGDTAHVETYVTQFTTLQDGGSLTGRKSARSHIVSGRYIDRLDRRNGEWRIAVREFIPHFFTETDSGLGYDFKWKTYGECGAGTQDRRDASYLRPLLPRKPGEAAPPCAKP